MNQITFTFTDDTAQTKTVGSGAYNAAIVSGTFTNVVISDDFNGDVTTITTTAREDLAADNFGITTPITVTPTGVSGTVTVKIQWKDA